MRRKNPCRWMLWVVLGAVIAGIALWNLLPPFLDRRSSAKVYDDLAGKYVEDGAEKEEAGQRKKDWWLTEVKVELDRLKEENPDVVGWIRFDNREEVGIDYPILHGKTNETYLRKDLYGNSHIAGSIFLESLNQGDFSDYYNIIYGHNMTDGSMFGNLKKYRDKGFWEKNQYFTVYSPKTVYRYRIFSYEEAVSGGDIYKVGYKPGEEYREFIRRMVEDSAVDTGIKPQTGNKILTLSTCTEEGDAGRLVIHAVCVDAQSTESLR